MPAPAPQEPDAPDARSGSQPDDSEETEDIGLPWSFVSFLLLGPALLAFVLPITGNYVVDVLVHGAPLLIMAVLFTALVNPGLALLRVFVKDGSRFSGVIAITYIVSLMAVCALIGYAAQAFIRDDAIAVFGETETAEIF